MQLRSKPFGEWVLIYYDKTQISEETLLELCKKGGCKRAAVIRDKKIEAGKSSALLLNPYICPGDSIALEIDSDGSEKIELELPEGWTCNIPEKISAKTTVFIQSSANSAFSDFSIKFKSGSKSAALNCHVVKKK